MNIWFILFFSQDLLRLKEQGQQCAVLSVSLGSDTRAIKRITDEIKDVGVACFPCPNNSLRLV